MNILKSICPSLLLLLCSCTTPQEYDIFLLIGQSNMAGRGRMIEADKQAIDGVYLLNNAGKVEKAVAPLNKYSTIRKDIRMQQISMGNNFSKEIHEKTGHKILLVVNARGGSSIKEWSPNIKDNFCDVAIERTRTALKYGKLKGILWHQGETDSDDPSFYMDSLKVIVTHLRKELKAKTVPFVAGEIAQWHKNNEQFNNMLHHINDHITHSDWVSSKDCSWLKNQNDPHFSREGQLILGKRYADKIWKMAYQK